jgi:3-oxoacyl-[acyl-carrier protein] reductase
MRLEDKVAIVTGAASGFGAGIAQRFAAEGARIVVNDLDAAGAARMASEIEGAGGRAVAWAGDVSSDYDVARHVASGRER